MPEDEKRIVFLKKLWYSIAKFEKYAEMSSEGLFSALKYLTVVMILFSLIVAIGYVIQLHGIVKNGTEYIKNSLPDLSYSNGKLNIDSKEPIKIDNNGQLVDNIIIDTNIESEEQINEQINSIPLDNTGIVIVNDGIIIKAKGIEEGIKYKYDEIIQSFTNKEITSLNKQELLDFLSNGMLNVYFSVALFIAGYTFIIYTISVLIDVLVIAILGYISTLIIRLKIRFSAIYNMAIYSMTLPLLLKAIYIIIEGITGFSLKYFQVMYISISFVYLIAAIFMIRIDFERKQAELMQIMEEQKKIKKENVEEENKKKEKKNKNKDKKLPEEKEGENHNNDEEPDESEA